MTFKEATEAILSKDDCYVNCTHFVILSTHKNVKHHADYINDLVEKGINVKDDSEAYARKKILMEILEAMKNPKNIHPLGYNERNFGSIYPINFEDQ